MPPLLQYTPCIMTSALHATEAAYDSAVQAPPGEEESQVQTRVCAPASGAQGTKSLKVSKGFKRRASGGSGGSTKINKKPTGEVEESSVMARLTLLEDKIKREDARKTAEFAATLLGNPHMPTHVSHAAEKILLDFLGCASTSKASAVPSSIPDPSSSDDSI